MGNFDEVVTVLEYIFVYLILLYLYLASYMGLLLCWDLNTTFGKAGLIITNFISLFALFRIYTEQVSLRKNAKGIK